MTSALGTLFVDVVHDAARSHIGRLAELDPDAVEAVFAALEEETRAALDDDLVPREAQRLERAVDVRYLGQLKTLTIGLPGGPVAAATLDAARAATSSTSTCAATSTSPRRSRSSWR